MNERDREPGLLEGKWRPPSLPQLAVPTAAQKAKPVQRIGNFNPGRRRPFSG